MDSTTDKGMKPIRIRLERLLRLALLRMILPLWPTVLAFIEDHINNLHAFLTLFFRSALKHENKLPNLREELKEASDECDDLSSSHVTSNAEEEPCP
jgi:hypothetical protein